MTKKRFWNRIELTCKINLSILSLSLLFFAAFGSERIKEGISRNSLESTNESAFKDRPVKHVIVYKEQGKFCGWPANHGIWAWGNEILVGFELGYYKENTTNHSFDRNKPKIIVMARSLDGGETWNLEKPDGLMPPAHGEPDSSLLPVGINFEHPEFAMKCNGPRFIISYDRGRSWKGPYKMPDLGIKNMMSRTDYIINSNHDCLVFSTAAKSDGKEGRPFAAHIDQGGGKIEFLSWIAPEPTGYSIMPSTVRITDLQLISAIRNYERGDVNKGWIDIYLSNDNGKSWAFLSKLAETGGHGGNPPSMVRLKDGRICVTYGYRSEPSGIRAKISNDAGKSWGEEIVLREDGRTWDLGYTRTVQRPDGELVTVYYYTTTENSENHIAATIWDPRSFK